jgi:hypothetical protein
VQGMGKIQRENVKREKEKNRIGVEGAWGERERKGREIDIFNTIHYLTHYIFHMMRLTLYERNRWFIQNCSHHIQ